MLRFCTVSGAPKVTLCGPTPVTVALVALPKVAESGMALDQVTLAPASTQFGAVSSQTPGPSAPSGASVPLASQARSRAGALPPPPQISAATAADRHAMRDRLFIVSLPVL